MLAGSAEVKTLQFVLPLGERSTVYAVSFAALSVQLRSTRELVGELAERPVGESNCSNCMSTVAVLL